MTDLEQCVQTLDSGEEPDRIYAAEDIGFANDAAGIPALLARLPVEPSRAVKEAIFAALLQIEDDGVVEGAVGLLDSEDSFLRNQAVELLRTLGSRTIPYLEAAFREGGPDRRKFVIDVVSRLADPSALRLCRRALHDSELNVVIAAVENAGNTRQVELREQIESMVTADAHPMLLGACIEALALIGSGASPEMVRSSFGGTERVPGYLRPSYLKLLGAKGSAEEVHEIASFAGVSALDSAVLNALTSLRNRYPEVAMPPQLAQPLRDMASKNPPQLAYHALRLLSGLIAETGIFDFLVARVDDPDKVIRIGAIQAVREGGGEAAEAALRGRLSGETDPEVLQAWGGKSAQ
ncbi:MAG TPA: HEAT repeat domain-containing protein [Bryobacteraceae bacterium]|nr:HEAT repeat domain-containing protein [Bryobacteraceae bacterium]